jgi:4-hydroxy-4-methyl-2-oxoglutarate aldolase
MTDMKMRETAEKFYGIPTGNICDSQGLEGAMAADLMPLHYRMKCAGVAMTVECVPGDNLTIHKAIAIAEPGTVLVITCKGYTDRGVFGDMFATSCRARGIKGVVIDGACRDKEDIIDLGFPVFSRGVSPNGTVKEQCGAIDEPISCAGVVVEPGDVVVGDADGVVIVKKSDAEDVLRKSAAKRDKEDGMRPLYEQGKTTVELMDFFDKLNMSQDDVI